MLHLLGRERRRALHELGIVGVVAGERQGVHGHLLLADRMIGQELGKIRRRELRPRAGRRVQEREGGEDLLVADRLGQAALVAGGVSHRRIIP